MAEPLKNYFTTDWQLSADKGKTWNSESQMTFWRKNAVAEASAPRGLPGFEAMVDEIDAEVEIMHQRVLESEESGNWDALRARTTST